MSLVRLLLVVWQQIHYYVLNLTWIKGTLVLYLAWFQSSSSKQMRTASLWAIAQRVVVIPYRCFGTISVPKRRQGITTTCFVIAQNSEVLSSVLNLSTYKCFFQNWIHSASISKSDSRWLVWFITEIKSAYGYEGKVPLCTGTEALYSLYGP
jgi:hypothetical protein